MYKPFCNVCHKNVFKLPPLESYFLPYYNPQPLKYEKINALKINVFGESRKFKICDCIIENISSYNFDCFFRTPGSIKTKFGQIGSATYDKHFQFVLTLL